MSKELTFTVLVIGIYFTVIYSPWVGLAVSLPAWIFSKGHEILYLAYHTLGRDMMTIRRFINVLIKTFTAKYMDWRVADKFLSTANRFPNKKMITFCTESGDLSLTFREVKEKSCQVARCFQQRGFSKGEVVAIVMENRIDYCCYWLGLSMLGVVPALINSNLRKDSLLHTITVAKCKAIIFSAELEEAVLDGIVDLAAPVELYCVDRQKRNEAEDLSALLSDQSTADFTFKCTGYSDDLFFIYTSGTTGLPKAAVIKNSRFMFTVYALYCMTKVTDTDVLYSPLPMYHTAAGAMVTGNALLEGVPIVTRKKFSATQYWADICRNNVTCAQYIGEVARYLYSTPPSEFEKKHKLRIMFGNGLRPEIWEKFATRFRIPLICEFYGSTEGNCSVGNISGKPGSVGFISVLFPSLFPLGLIAVDEETREPLRDKNGLCIPCPVGLTGELVGRIDKGHPVRDFHGYADREATKKKVLSDVWKMGDFCFRSGDIFVMDELGWLYFKDRSGDTFRWKGENVSTTEIESICSSIVGQQDCVVYGVQVPGCEGRAGMLALPDPLRKVDLSDLFSGLEARLPSYSWPIFIRIVDAIEITGTFKLKKRDLQVEGFNVHKVKDPLFILDTKTRSYIEMTAEHFRLIEEGRMKL